MAKAIVGVAYLAMVAVIAVTTKNEAAIFIASMFGGISAVVITAMISD
ncbi:hypothetical protein M1513_00750 [Patescibacteria group bacterium]|nr:hypothetical protein [Patescibacteria group bacterium]